MDFSYMLYVESSYGNSVKVTAHIFSVSRDDDTEDPAPRQMHWFVSDAVWEAVTQIETQHWASVQIRGIPKGPRSTICKDPSHLRPLPDRGFPKAGLLMAVFSDTVYTFAQLA